MCAVGLAAPVSQPASRVQLHVHHASRCGTATRCQGDGSRMHAGASPNSNKPDTGQRLLRFHCAGNAYSQCGGTGGSCGSNCIDAEWPGAACPAGTVCARHNMYWWSCKPLEQSCNCCHQVRAEAPRSARVAHASSCLQHQRVPAAPSVCCMVLRHVPAAPVSQQWLSGVPASTEQLAYGVLQCDGLAGLGGSAAPRIVGGAERTGAAGAAALGQQQGGAAGAASTSLNIPLLAGLLAAAGVVAVAAGVAATLYRKRGGRASAAAGSKAPPQPHAASSPRAARLLRRVPAAGAAALPADGDAGNQSPTARLSSRLDNVRHRRSSATGAGNI